MVPLSAPSTDVSKNDRRERELFKQGVISSEIQLAAEALRAKEGGDSRGYADANSHVSFINAPTINECQQSNSLEGASKLSLADLLSELSPPEIQRFVELRSKLLNYKMS